MRYTSARLRLILLPALLLSGEVSAQRQGAMPGATASDAAVPPDADALNREGRARNVILFIGDGMGDSEITLARYYSAGATGRLALDTLPVAGVLTTYSILESAPHRPNYVPDSAAAATAWATGVKTSNGRIATTAGDDRDLKTALEHARERGYRTGNVTTTELTDATPAALAAHVAHRDCQGPADMLKCPQDRRAAGGPGSIAEQMIEHDVDVLLGGGAVRFEQRDEAGRRVVDVAVERGYRVVRTREELAAQAPGERVLGLFAPGNMSTEWTGRAAAPYPSNVASPQLCRPGSRGPGEPTLEEMTAHALRLLDRSGPDGPGFFLQVEGGSIDKQNHEADPCGQIGETVGFDRAVRLGLDYARAHPDTLVVVTADHGHSSQIVATPTAAEHPAGPISTLLTVDGAPVTVSYGTGTPGMPQGHTGTQIRIAAAGPQAHGVAGVRDQTELFPLLMRAIGADQPATPGRQTSAR
jgi:alkaline phosphatase